MFEWTVEVVGKQGTAIHVGFWQLSPIHFRNSTPSFGLHLG